MAVPTGSRRADASALEALVDAAAGILATDSLSDTLGGIAHHLGELLDYDELSVYEVDRAAEMLVEESGFQALLMVPLVFGGRDVGLLELYRRHPIPWNSGEIERAQLLAHQLGAVIDFLGRTAGPA